MTLNLDLKNMILISLLAALTAVGALIYIPLPVSPVPVTLQLFFTFLAGGLLGRKSGFLSQLIYLLLGAIGLPVFSGGMGGIGTLFGPTAGFLFGFLIAGYVAGMGKKKFWTKIIYFSLALIIVYIMGMTGLMITTGISPVKALTTGVVPFIIGDIFKLLLAAYLTERIPIDKVN